MIGLFSVISFVLEGRHFCELPRDDRPGVGRKIWILSARSDIEIVIRGASGTLGGFLEMTHYWGLVLFHDW
jgi:hypothetical protein